ncbi:hypothetical protein D018_3552A, partial [Vibrio parahaemolyticus VP2007-007]
MRSPA